MNLGMWEILLILFILLLLFGARRLPEIGGSLGKGIKEFKNSVKEVGRDASKELGPGDSGDAGQAGQSHDAVRSADREQQEPK